MATKYTSLIEVYEAKNLMEKEVGYYQTQEVMLTVIGYRYVLDIPEKSAPQLLLHLTKLGLNKSKNT